MLRLAGSSLFRLSILCILCIGSQAAAQPIRFTFVGIIGGAGVGVGQVMTPSSVTVDPAGNVYVADTGNNRIQQYTMNGQYIRSLGGFGFNAQQFNQPMDVVATGLDVYVADTQNRRIQRFDRRMNFLGALSSASGQDDIENTFGFPRGIALSGIGDIYFTDIENEEVVKMNTSGRIEVRFGGFSDGRGRLRSPAGIAVDRTGRIYVADTGNDRVAVFDAFGGYLRAVGADSLRAPEGVEVDDEGRIYVADTGNDRIAVFAPDGKRLFVFGVSGTGPGSFQKPRDVAIGQDGAVYVADTGNHRIQKFEARTVEE